MNSARSKKKVLFLCSRNQVRSRTAEVVYRDRPDLEVRSAGLAEYATVPLTQELFEWADEVFVFSKRQRKAVEARFPNSFGGKTVICLNLPDRFEYKSPELVTELTRRVYPHLGAPANAERTSTRKPPAPGPVPPVREAPVFRGKRLQLRGVAAWSILCSVGSWLFYLLLGPSQLR